MQTSRRHALKIGSIAALTAGLMANNAPVKAAEPKSDLVAALCDGGRHTGDDFAAWLEEWRAEQSAMLKKVEAIQDRISAYVPSELHHELVNTLSDALGDLASHERDRERELIVRHMPGLESVLRLLFAHALDTYLDQEERCGAGACRDQIW